MTGRGERRVAAGKAGAHTSGERDAVLARSILDTADDAFIATDVGGNITEWNLAAERMFGHSRQDVLGRDLAETIIPERDRSAHRRAVERALTMGKAFVVGRPMQLTGRHRDGHEIQVEVRPSLARVGDEPDHRLTLHAFLRDISLRRLSEEVLVAMQSVTRAMARADSPDHALQSALAALGESMHWQVGAYWALAADRTLVCAADWRDADTVAEPFTAHTRRRRLASGEGLPGRALARGGPVWVSDFTTDPSQLRMQADRQDGLHAAICAPVVQGTEIVGVLEFLTSELQIHDDSPAEALSIVGEQVGELLGILQDRQALMASLARLALTDQLTGLPNRRAWEERLQRELARSARDGHPVCVAVLDLDEFKRYNDLHGHQRGDALLAAAAQAWQEQLRGGDLLARYGGEEFAAVIPAWPLKAAVLVIDRVRAVTPEGQTCSAGVAAWNGSETASALFARADRALYEAKEAGRDRTIAAAT